MINVNPATLYPRANYTTLDDKLIFATSYIAGFFEFKKYLEEYEYFNLIFFNLAKLKILFLQ